MAKGSECKNSIFENNKGFSIVEVMIAVAIIATVFVPLLKSFSMAATVNGRSQRLQNATSLAEDIMENVKGKSIIELEDIANSDSKITFATLPEVGGVSPGYTMNYADVTATKGTTYDVKVTIDKTKYSADKSSMSETDEGYSDISDANVRELPKINKVDSHKHAVLSWEINQYDKKAMENLAAENATADGEIAHLKNTYKSSAEKNINILIKNESGMTKITCEVEYKTSTAGDRSLNYLVYSGYFEDQKDTPLGGPNVYLFYTLSEKVKEGNTPISEPFKIENIKVYDDTEDQRHSVYFIMQDDINSLSTVGGSSVSLDISGRDWADSVSYNKFSSITESTKVLNTTTDGKVIFGSNLKDTNDKIGDLYDSKSKTRIYYVTVEVMEHGKTDVVATLTSTMQAGKEAN